MHQAIHAAARARASGGMRRRSLATAGIAAVIALAATGTGARADVAVSGSVEVTALPLPLSLSCFACPLSVSATSSGDISGVDGTAPFDASWADPPTGGTNFTVQGGYTSGCESVAWAGATIAGGTYGVVSGVTLLYNGTTYANASVKITFLGDILEGVFAPLTQTVEIDGGPHPISLFIPVSGDPGALATVPTSPPPLCPGGTQTFSASGVFLALG
jgi:hypothetical protein